MVEQYSFKPILLDLLQWAQSEQNAFYQKLPADELTITIIGTAEHWSVKDHVAHLTFWRERLVLFARTDSDLDALRDQFT